MRFTGYLPPSINGCKFSITAEGKARGMGHESTEIHWLRKQKPQVI
jgi:hypothetical protein